MKLKQKNLTSNSLVTSGRSIHTVYYSWNEGKTWSPFKISEQKLEIDNIIIEPTATSQKFMVYGSRKATKAGDKNSQPVGAVYFLDFSELHARRCKGVEAPGTPDSDYERWSPSDGRLGEKCLLGHQITYIRRKHESQCFNGEKLDRMQYVKDCACTESDYECDVGYVRKVEGGPCTPVGGSDSKGAVVTRGQPPENCPSGTTYGVTNGYRKVAGDTCSGGIDRNPSLFPCPHWSTTVSHGGWVVLLILLCIVCGFGGAAFSKSKGKNASANRLNSFSSNFNGSASGIYSTACRVWGQFLIVAKNRTIIQVTVLLARAVIPESAVGTIILTMTWAMMTMMMMTMTTRRRKMLSHGNSKSGAPAAPTKHSSVECPDT